MEQWKKEVIGYANSWSRESDLVPVRASWTKPTKDTVVELFHKSVTLMYFPKWDKLKSKNVIPDKWQRVLEQLDKGTFK